MKRLLFSLFVFNSLGAIAQNNMGIGTPNPHPSSILELQSSDKGLLVPRLSTAQRVAILSPATGLLVYDTELNQFWYFNGAIWVQAIGPQGPQGLQGPAGPTGADGPQGPQGLQGPAGPTGADGPQGPQGLQGPAGPTGADGPQGPQGTQGPAGPTGADGPQGPQGPQGLQGPAGPTGADGPQGPQGTQGPAGPTGADGPQGLQGPAGPTGADGPQGPQGLQGPAGPTGADGPQGPQGLQGPAGPTGADGPQGPQGLQGPAGPTGADGPQGPQGLQGPAGPTGADGPQGPQGLQGPAGPTGADGANAFCGTAASNFIGKFTSPTIMCNSIMYDDGNNIGISTTSPITKLHVNGDARVGLIYPGPSGAYPGYGNFLIFSGGPSGGGTDSENTDYLSLARFNVSNDVSDLRMTIGDNPGPDNRDYFSIGSVGSNFNLFAVRSDGNVGVGVRDAISTFEVRGKSTFSRDGAAECCGNDATIVIAEVPGSSGRRSSISFHNSGEAEGTLRLIQNNVGQVNTASRRIQLFDNQSNGLGLELSGGLFYGTNNSRTWMRDNAGLQGNAGAQSGFFETENPSNFPSGASGWWHLLDVRHNNPGNNYAMQFSGSFYNQKLYMRKTNGSATTAWSRVPNSTDASNSAGYLFFDVGAANGTVEGTVQVDIVNGTLQIRGYNEANALQGVWHQISNVANAKVVVLITNDDTNNCGSNSKVSMTRVYTVTNGGGTSSQSTDMGCSASDGNVMTFMIAYNPL